VLHNAETNEGHFGIMSIGMLYSSITRALHTVYVIQLFDILFNA
jgi:hypothetical protein